MHWIPQSWSHWHILVSVFPSVGLVFVLGCYVAAIITDNEVMKRTCLVPLCRPRPVGHPDLSQRRSFHGAAVAEFEDFPGPARQPLRLGRGGARLAGAGGLAALIALWRSRRGRLTDNALHLALGLAVVTLGVMVVASELGWEISHHELRLDPKTQKTSQTWSHAHMILNHFPTVGFVFALVFYVTALVANNDAMKRSSLVLFVICAILGIPAYVTGAASMWALTDPAIPGISRAVINAHRDMALWTLFGLGFTGVAAWIELWRYRHLARFSRRSLYLILAFAVVTLAVMAETGHRGGQINHPEIILPTDVLPTDPKAGLSVATELLINQVLWFVPWQTLHFFGFSLVFGTALVVSLRVLGCWKSILVLGGAPAASPGGFRRGDQCLQRNADFLADSHRYLTGITFVPKIAFLVIGAMAVLYFSVSERLWQVKAGEDAPMGAKWVAAVVLLSWAGVITGGRLLTAV